MCGCNECNGLTLFPGQDGVGILSITDNGNGTFTFLLTNGTTFTTSDLTGPQGPVGPQGPTGATGATGTVLVTSIHDAGAVYGNTLQAIGAPSGYLFTKWDTIPDGSLFEMEILVSSFNDVPPIDPLNYLGFKFTSASEYIAFSGTTTPLIPIPNVMGNKTTAVRITLTKKSSTTAHVAMIATGDFSGPFIQSGSAIAYGNSYGVSSEITIGATSSERLVVYGLPAIDGTLNLDRLTIKLYLND